LIPIASLLTKANHAPHRPDAIAFRTNSSHSKLPPAAEHVIDQLRSFLAIPFLETIRRAKYSLPVVCAQQHHLVLKSAGTELHAGIIADSGEIADGLELSEPMHAVMPFLVRQCAALPIWSARLFREVGHVNTLIEPPGTT
jgi:hypothetical protein